MTRAYLLGLVLFQVQHGSLFMKVEFHTSRPKVALIMKKKMVTSETAVLLVLYSELSY